MKKVKDYIGTKTAIHCKSEEEAKQICKIFEELGDEPYINNATGFLIDRSYALDFEYRGFISSCFTQDLIENGYKILEASEFLEHKLEIEFGCVKGHIDWAYKVAEREGKVYHRIYAKCGISNRSNCLITEYSDKVDLIKKSITGWTRKQITPKEELIKEIKNLSVYKTDGACMIDDILNIVKDYKIEKNDTRN